MKVVGDAAVAHVMADSGQLLPEDSHDLGDSWEIAGKMEAILMGNPPIPMDVVDPWGLKN